MTEAKNSVTTKKLDEANLVVAYVQKVVEDAQQKATDATRKADEATEELQQLRDEAEKTFQLPVDFFTG